jgi:membrane associated rhomboid family serine protease
MFPLTPWVKRLLIANVAIHVIATMSGALLYQWGEFVPALVLIRPWTVLTYMFLHAPGLEHLLLNMLTLFFFGPRVEERLGGKDFMTLYLLGGIGGAAFSFIFSPNAGVVGASAALFAVLTAFAMYWPRARIYIWGILPVEAWLLVVGYVLYNLWSGVGGTGGNVANFAHIGGAVFGFGYLKWHGWRRGAPRRAFQQRVTETPSTALSDKTALQRWEAIDTRTLHELNRDEVDLLLQKARVLGVRGLTPEERAFLDRMSTRH